MLQAFEISCPSPPGPFPTVVSSSGYVCGKAATVWNSSQSRRRKGRRTRYPSTPTVDPTIPCASTSRQPIEKIREGVRRLSVMIKNRWRIKDRLNAKTGFGIRTPFSILHLVPFCRVSPVLLRMYWMPPTRMQNRFLSCIPR